MKTTCVTIDEDLFNAAKEAKLNLSALLREALKQQLNFSTASGKPGWSKDMNALIRLETELSNTIPEAQNMLQKLKEYHASWDDKEKARQESIISHFSGCPELNNLSDEHLESTSFLMNLAGTVNTKYGLTGIGKPRASVSTIREFYLLKKKGKK